MNTLKVYYQKDCPPIIQSISGDFSADCIAGIQKDIEDDPELYFKDDGEYLFSCNFIKNDPDEGGSHWELDKVNFRYENLASLL